MRRFVGASAKSAGRRSTDAPAIAPYRAAPDAAI